MSTKVAHDLIAVGLSIIPIKNKVPTILWKDYQTRLPRIDELTFNGSIGLICGPVSGNVEAIDVDTKNDLTGNLIERMQTTFIEFGIALDFVAQKTPSGGLHLVYKCENIEGNQVLARSKDKKPIIETRGIGGYIAIDPTPGYKVGDGSFNAIPTITVQEREDLFTACRALNEYFEEIQAPAIKQIDSTALGISPWEAYNLQADVPKLLDNHGWKFLKQIGDNQHFCRPDKKGSTSATWNGKTFYCFTSSTVFEPSKAYSPTALYTLLECHGDFSEASKRLYAEGYGHRILKDRANNHAVIKTPTNLFRLTKSTTMERPKKILGVLWAHGELCYNFGEDGSGKTILSVQVACAIATGETIPGFINELPAQPVTYFDAELSDYQFNNRYPGGLPTNFKRLTFNEEAQSALINAEISFVVDQIEQAANEQKSKIIILDNLSALTSMLDLTKTSDSIQLMGLLNDLKRKGFSIMVIDHTRKPMHEGEFKIISKNDLQGSKMKSNLADSVFSIGKSCQGENIRYIKALKIRSFEMAYTKNSVATMSLKTDPLRFDFIETSAEWEHVNDKNSEIMKGASQGLSQREIAEKFGISQQAVSKKLRNV